MNFTVNKGKKRILSFRIFYATIGGKIVLALAVIFFILGTVGIVFFDDFVEMATNSAWGESTVNDDANSFPVECGIALFYFGTFVCLVCGWIQRNAGVAMRNEEQLSLENIGTADEMLYYCYKKIFYVPDFIFADRMETCVYKFFVEISLSEVFCKYDEKSGMWNFDGNISITYCDVSNTGTLIPRREETKKKFSIGAYFGDEFDQEMSRWAEKKVEGTETEQGRIY